MDIYQDIILDHYQHPRNFGVLSDTESVSLENPSCGDSITLQIKLKDNCITEIAFQGKGCAISQASTSLLTDFVKGKSKEEVDALDKNAILKLLGVELSPARLKCAMLGLQTLQKLLTSSKVTN